jgi:hypothetical protein
MGNTRFNAIPQTKLELCFHGTNISACPAHIPVPSISEASCSGMVLVPA